MRLIVRSFSPSDVGTYHCVSTNSLGRAEGTLRLYGKYLFMVHIFFRLFWFFILIPLLSSDQMNSKVIVEKLILEFKSCLFI